MRSVFAFAPALLLAAVSIPAAAHAQSEGYAPKETATQVADATAGEAPAAAETPKAERKICKYSGNTGARLGGKKLCLTRREWAKIDD